MKQIFRTNSGRLIKDVPMPKVADKEVLVKVHTSVISTGTETSNDKKKSGFKEKKEILDKVLKMMKEQGVSKTYNRVIKQLTSSERNILLQPVGYSNAGVVISKGRLVTNFSVGDRVACCGAGIASHAEYVTVPVNLAAKLRDNVNYTEGAFSTIGSIAMQGIRRSRVSFGETVIITGLGLLGLLAVQIAKAWGLVVIGIDINNDRLELAKSLGADLCLNGNDSNLESIVKEYTHGIGGDAVVIYAATKSSDPVNQAFDLCRKKGVVVAVGAFGMDLKRDKMYEKELDFVMSTSYGPGRYDDNYELFGHDYPIGYVRWTENRNMQEFIRLLSTNQINVKALIGGKYSVIEAIDAFSNLVEDKSHIANIIEYPFGEIGMEKGKFILTNSDKIIGSNKIRVGIIGAGGFIKGRHLANMVKLKEKYQIVAICNNTPGSSIKEGEIYGAKYVTTNYEELLEDNEINLIVIGTRHNLHAQIVLKAIKAGKHVLVEKPLAMTIDEIEEIKRASQRNPEVILFVGFNRRFAPFVQTIKSKLTGLNKKMVINYRVNAGYIDPLNWVQLPEIGGGRLVGEGCHFIDLISYLSGGDLLESDIISVPISKETPSEDNFIINLKYSNGNIGVLTYTSIGGDSMPKERLEVFCNNTSYVIDDFKTLTFFGSDNTKETVLQNTDKGHFRLIEEIYKKLKGMPNIVEDSGLDVESSEQTIIFNNIINGLK